MRPDTKITMLAIVSIMTLELFALAQGIDGTLYALSISFISGLAGYKLRDLKEIIK